MTSTGPAVVSRVERAARRWLVTPLFLAARISVIAMCLATLADIASRHLLGYSVAGIVEWVELALVWSAFTGIAIAFWTGAHVSVELIESVAPGRVVAVLDMAKALIVLAVVTGLAGLAVAELLDKLHWGDRTIDLGLPYTWFWGAVVVGYAAAALLLAARAIALWRIRSTT